MTQERKHVHHSSIALEDVEESHFLEGRRVHKVPYHPRGSRGAHECLKGAIWASGEVRLGPHEALPKQLVVLCVPTGYLGGEKQGACFNCNQDIQV
jgi:hypothetical protein